MNAWSLSNTCKLVSEKAERRSGAYNMRTGALSRLS